MHEVNRCVKMATPAFTVVSILAAQSLHSSTGDGNARSSHPYVAFPHTPASPASGPAAPASCHRHFCSLITAPHACGCPPGDTFAWQGVWQRDGGGFTVGPHAALPAGGGVLLHTAIGGAPQNFLPTRPRSWTLIRHFLQLHGQSLHG